MSDRAMMYCPTCRDFSPQMGNPALKQVELARDMDALRCPNGHTFPDYAALMAMNPELIKLVPTEKPQPTDVKAEFWIDPKILAKFEEKYPNQKSATVASILSCFLYGQPIIIDGVQAKKLREEYGVRTGQEMIAALGATKEQESEMAGLRAQITMLTNLLTSQNKEVAV